MSTANGWNDPRWDAIYAPQPAAPAPQAPQGPPPEPAYIQHLQQAAAAGTPLHNVYLNGLDDAALQQQR